MRIRPALCLALIAASVTGCGEDQPVVAEAPRATFVGGESCARCHQVQRDLWTGSHHDLAMQIADDRTVLGDFSDASFTNFGVTSSFHTRDGAFYVHTEGPDGELRDYEVKYTFGATPLQQYLVEFPRGRLQALGIAWDSRPASEGGQRWFHLYDEKIAHDDPLHWTGRNQNWNYMCAECHSTDLRKNYDLDSDSFWTRWSEIDVSCEACHGPGSEHVDWADSLDRGETPGDARDMGLQLTLKDPEPATWVFDPGAVTARREPPSASRPEIEACARCHSRRGTITSEYVHGRPLMDTHRPALLEEHLYHPDGQIEEEVYVYGSFLQSKMYDKGVTCTDCHEPHGLNLIAQANSLCARCHSPESFDTPDHHFHEAGSPGAACVECHMPATTYMVVDPRRDHSIRIPRPDLSIRLGTPNACNGCHDDQSAAWAAAAVEEWYGPANERPVHFGEVLHTGREGKPESIDALAEVVRGEYPGIVRATAMQLLGRFRSTIVTETIAAAAVDPDPLVRRAALGGMGDATIPDRLRVGFKMLRDPILAVRIEAASVLAPARRAMTVAQTRIFDRVAEEYASAQMVNADQPWAHYNLGNLYGQIGRYDEAEIAFRKAMELDPSFVEPYVNLADMFLQQRREVEGEELLREAVRKFPTSADVRHSLGLLLVRLDRRTEALASLEKATNLDPENARYAFVYGIGLYDEGRRNESLRVLKNAHRQRPGDTDILYALATVHRDLGLREEARRYARDLVALDPEDVDYRRLLQELERDG